jgi:hypothetical protein
VNIGVGRYLFAVVIIVALGASIFRVATAPERAKQRRDLARQTCVETGGEWVQAQRDGICRKPGESQ